jgi:hypothetical protein
MKNNKVRNIVLICFFILVRQIGFSQGFVNLDFEHPTLPLNPVNSMVPIGAALPGWTGYAGTTQLSSGTQIWYDTISLGAAAISLQGPGSTEPILQGSYTVGLQGSSAGAPESVGIGQTGQVPMTAESLLFLGTQGGNLQVTFNGQLLPTVQLGIGPNGVQYGADISAFAGQTGQLLFTAPPNGGDFLDNIQFSPNVIPEPSMWALMLCGARLLAFGKWKRGG